jgi:hypothetical protein
LRVGWLNAGVCLNDCLCCCGLRDSASLKRTCYNDRRALADRSVRNSSCRTCVRYCGSGCCECLREGSCKQDRRSASCRRQNHSRALRRDSICWTSSCHRLLYYAGQNDRRAVKGSIANQSTSRSGNSRSLLCGDLSLSWSRSGRRLLDNARQDNRRPAGSRSYQNSRSWQR